MNNETDYSAYENTIAAIRNSLTAWSKYCSDSHYDKKGIGINRDSQFSAVKLEISIDSWAGPYGRSECSRVVLVGNQELFKKAFIKVLNSKLLALLQETADQLEKDSANLKASEIVKLKKRLADLGGG